MLQKFVYGLAAFLLIFGFNLGKNVDAQNRTTQEKVVLITDAIYADGLMRSDNIVELVASSSQDTLGILTATDNYICHLLVKRGHITALFYLMERLDDSERTKLVKRLNDSHLDGLLVQERVVLHTCSPYWVHQFQNLGLDFSIPFNSDKDQQNLEKSVVARWGKKTEAYMAYLSIKNGSANVSKGSLSVSETAKLTKDITYRPAVHENLKVIESTSPNFKIDALPRSLPQLNKTKRLGSQKRGK